jgi:hypothetical protein
MPGKVLVGKSMVYKEVFLTFHDLDNRLGNASIDSVGPCSHLKLFCSL